MPASEVDLRDYRPFPRSKLQILRVRALRAGRALTFQREGRAIRFDVPTVADYEVVALT